MLQGSFANTCTKVLSCLVRIEVTVYLFVFPEDEAPAKPATPMVNGKPKKGTAATPASAKKPAVSAQVSECPHGQLTIYLLKCFGVFPMSQWTITIQGGPLSAVV